MVLINTLAESKITSDDIKIKVAEAEKTELSIDETREVSIQQILWKFKKKTLKHYHIHVENIYKFITNFKNILT